MAARTGLTREDVVEAATALVDQDGWKQLSMTTLARKVGVQSPTLYHHVGSLEALGAEVQVRAMEQQANRLQRAAMGKVGAGCFRALADELCAYAIEHPGLYELSQSEPIDPVRTHVASEGSRSAGIAVIESFGIANPSLDLLLTCLAPLHGVLALARSGAIATPKKRTAIYGRVTDLVISLLEDEGKA